MKRYIKKLCLIHISAWQRRLKILFRNSKSLQINYPDLAGNNMLQQNKKVDKKLHQYDISDKDQKNQTARNWKKGHA